eukprot:6212513-Pleurochrysis_carterae.AAC.3
MPAPKTHVESSCACLVAGYMNIALKMKMPESESAVAEKTHEKALQRRPRIPPSLLNARSRWQMAPRKRVPRAHGFGR